MIARPRGRESLGTILGFLFGPWGLLLACLLPELHGRADAPAPRRHHRSAPEYPPELPTGRPPSTPGDPLDFLRE
jgi:hypothetical protein